MLFLDLVRTPAGNKQAVDRCARIGQSRGVLITHLVANHVLENRFYEALAEKSDVFEGAVDASAVE